MKMVKMSLSFLLVLSVLDTKVTKSLLPETIATTTLLKYGGTFVAAALGGRCIVQGATKFSQKFNMQIPKYPDTEFYTITESSDNEFKNIVTKNMVYAASIKQDFFNRIKQIVASETIEEKPNNSYQKSSSQEGFDQNSWTMHHWNQTNVNAQQARGFMPKINNTYYYHSGNESFWKGFSAGTFLTGITYHCVDSKNKKN